MPKLHWIEIQGFRAFGCEAARLAFTGNLAIVCGPNSQGKTSLAEAIEFLLTGGTVRREFLASAKSEFSDCLRNVHLPDGTEVLVRAEIEDSSGASHVVSRKLLTDYTAQDDCRTELTIDGTVVPNLESIGLPLSEPPLRAPILMQHTLRYVVSARPTDRSDYFKALLEVNDLDVIRGAIADLQNIVVKPASSLLTSLRKCAAIPGLAEIPKKIESEGLRAESLESALSEALRIVLTSAGLTDGEISSNIQGRITLLKQTLDSRRESAFPITALTLGTGANAQFTSPSISDIQQFSEMVGEVNREAAKLTQLFSAVLAIPGLAEASSPVDCPVCQTEDALTPERMDAMRRQIALSRGLEEMKTKAERELSNLRASLTSVSNALGRILPGCSSWNDEKRQEHRRIIETILEGNDVMTYDQLFLLPAQIAENLTSTRQCLDALADNVELAEERVREFREIPIEALTAAIASATDAWRKSTDLILQYRESSNVVTGIIRRAIDGRSNFTEWQDLINVSENRREIETELSDVKARASVLAEIENAVGDIDRSKASVFDGKFLSLSDEIERWWERLRPDELVAFGGLRRRGTGRRFVDFKALISSERGGTSIERDAAGVLSDSQLNCLGVSAFLARCIREKCQIIVLDDPVPVSDLEHRATFANYVVGELLSNGIQVIITTYDEELNRILQHYYAHVASDCFSIEMANSKDGASFWKTSDTLEALIVAARPFLKNQNREIRKIAAHRLRDAAERLCKEIIVKYGSSTSTPCTIADFGGKMLSELVPKTEPFLTKDASHSGKLRVIGRLLNPGSHDTVVPEAMGLGVACGDLEMLKREYL